MIEEEQLLVTRFSKDYVEYVIHNYDFRKMRGKDNEDSFKNTWKLSKKRNQDYFTITGENDKIEYQRLLSDSTISNYLIIIYDSCRGTNIQAYGLKEKIERILELIRSDLKQKK